jgi:hypothetical protein
LISLLAVLALGAVAPLSAGAAISGGAIQFVTIGGSGSPPTDTNANGILDRGDYLVLADTLQVTGSSVAQVPPGTLAALRGVLMLQSSSLVRATLELALPTGSFQVVGWFSASVFEGSGESFSLFAQGRNGMFSRAQGQLQVAPNETTTFTLALRPFSFLPTSIGR